MNRPALIRLRLLGRLEITFRDDPNPVRFSTRKSGALLACLAMAPEQTAGREELATLLWGSCSDQQARQSLRQALTFLRKVLPVADCLIADTKVVRLQPGVWSIDASDFEILSRSSEARELARAGDLFGGEFLTGLNIEEEGFDEWVNVQRQRMQSAASRLCETYAERPDLVIDGDAAVAVIERLLTIDPLREDWHRLALVLVARYRGKNDALARAEALAAVLRRELGVAPDKETRALIEKIRAATIASAGMAQAQLSDATDVAVQESGVLAATVERPTLAEATVAPQGPAVSQPIRSRHWFAPRVAAAAAVIALALAGGWFSFAHNHFLPASSETGSAPAASAEAQPPQQTPHQAADNPTPGIPSGVAAIVVMPFTVVGAGSERSTLMADLMSDDLTNLLGRIGGFRVISRRSAAGYRGKHVDPAAVGKELGVRYLVQGNVETQGENLRANVELVDTLNGQHVWSARFDRSGADLPAIQEEVIRGIGRELQTEVVRIESGRDSEGLDAHTMIYKGFAALAEVGRIGTPALEEAEKYFSQVLAREPDNTRAMTGLGAYHIRMAAQPSTADPASHFAKAEALLTQAMERRPDVGGPSRFMGSLQMARGRADLAISWFEREIEHNPSHPGAYAGLGQAMARTGKPEEGLRQILYAIRLSPRDPLMPAWLGFAGAAELELAHDEKAIEYLDRSLALQPKQTRTLLVLAAAHALTGKLDAVRSRLDELRTANPNLSSQKLIERYFRDLSTNVTPRLKEGLRLIASEGTNDPWASPPPPSKAGGETAAVANKSIVPILVLPFKTFGETAGSTELLADMVTDDLTNLLSRVQFMRVISRQTALTFKGQPVDVAGVGSELHVRYVLDGSMRMQGDKLRVNVELINPQTRLPVWSTRIERESADRYSTVDEIVGRLARELQFDISGIESARRSNDADADALAYRGWAALTQINLQGYKQAESYFKQALERDPQNLSAQIGLGAYHARIGVHILDDEPDAHREKARNILQDVIRREPRSSIAYEYLGLTLGYLRTLPQSVEAYEHAIELDPSNASAHAQIGHALSRTGRPAEGLKHIRYAMRLSPRDPIMPAWFEFVGHAELELNQFEQAAESFRRSTELNPGYPRAWSGLAAAHALAGHSGEARVDVEKLRTFAPTLDAPALIQRFGRPASRLHDGLLLAFAHAKSN